MAKRRAFIPTSLSASILETRLAPSGNFFGQIGTFFDKIGNQLGIKHHSSDNAAAGIAHLWSESNKLSKPNHHHVAKVK